MCIAPNTLADGTQIACRKCWQCQERAINDWTGRCIAESKTAVATHVVNLTYGRVTADVHHERSVILTYSDVQKYLKLLRRHDYPVRYLVAGEYGSLKGRAHWHIVLFWQKRVPPHVIEENFMEEHWPHGWSFWQVPDGPGAYNYVVKYLQKDFGDDEKQYHLAMSKKPPIGARYFQKVAERYVRQGLAPQTLEYSWIDVRRRKKDGSQEVIPFMLKGRSAEMYLQHYVDEWDRVWPERDYPSSKLLDEFFDPGAWRERPGSIVGRLMLEDDPRGLPTEEDKRRHLRTFPVSTNPEYWPANFIGNRRSHEPQ